MASFAHHSVLSHNDLRRSPNLYKSPEGKLSPQARSLL